MNSGRGALKWGLPLSTAWRSIARPDLLLDFQADLGSRHGFCAWYEHIVSRHDCLTSLLGNASIDECAEWREQWLDTEPALHGSEAENHRASLCRNLLGALHSTSIVARYLDVDRQTVIDCAFPCTRIEALDKAEALLADKTSVVYKSGGVLRRTILGREIGMSGERAMQLAERLGYEKGHASSAESDYAF